jgi:hypothetical protein
MARNIERNHFQWIGTIRAMLGVTATAASASTELMSVLASTLGLGAGFIGGTFLGFKKGYRAT